jgi:amphiphysin
MEKETNNLQKDAKTYLDAMRGELGSQLRNAGNPGAVRPELMQAAMASSQTRIAETIALFYTADRASDVSLLPNRSPWCGIHDRVVDTA